MQELSGGTPSATLLTGGIDQVFTRTDAAGTRTLLPDALGAVLGLVDEAGVLRTEYTYDPFGATTSSGQPSANPTRFTGREDDGTGLYFYRARYYSPSLQRFLSEDPLGFGGGDPNLYAYVGNRPTNLTDPGGQVPAAVVAALVGCLVDASISAASGVAINVLTGRKVTLTSVARDAVVGCLTGAAMRMVARLPGVSGVIDDALRAVGAACSFPADTVVATADGQRRIGELRAGAWVRAYDEATGTTGDYPVTAVAVHTDPVIQLITIAGEVVETTPAHPFSTVEQGWVAAGDLRVGDHVRRADGSAGVVETAWVETRSEPMYTLSVAVAHTFFVGDGQWLVHNACRPLTFNQMEQAIKRGKAPAGIQRVDRGRTAFEKPHVHIRDSGGKIHALNNDGTWKHGSMELTRAQKDWLRENGWTIPGD